MVRADIEPEFPTAYESGLEEAIEELRVQNERECAQYKVELEYRYKEKVSSWTEPTRSDWNEKSDYSDSTHFGSDTRFRMCFSCV